MKFRHKSLQTTSLFFSLLLFSCLEKKEQQFHGSFSDFALECGLYEGAYQDFQQLGSGHVGNSVDTLLLELLKLKLSGELYYTGLNQDVHRLDNLRMLKQCSVLGSPEFEDILNREKEIRDDTYRFWFLSEAFNLLSNRNDYSTTEIVLACIRTTGKSESQSFQMDLAEYRYWIGQGTPVIDLPNLDSCLTLTSKLRLLMLYQVNESVPPSCFSEIVEEAMKNKENLSRYGQVLLAHLLYRHEWYYKEGSKMFMDLADEYENDPNILADLGWCESCFTSPKEQWEHWEMWFKKLDSEFITSGNCKAIEQAYIWYLSNQIFDKIDLGRTITNFLNKHSDMCCQGVEMLKVMQEVSNKHPDETWEGRKRIVLDSLKLNQLHSAEYFEHLLNEVKDGFDADELNN